MSVVNQYSFIITLLVMSLAAGMLFRKGFNPQQLILLTALLIGIISIWLGTKPTQNLSASQDQSQTWIGGGKPVFLEFQSPY